ncbi:hypothetical protein C8J57DRAFT_1421249 [Mycena rebaudengoi]|nr:hypothetical protein C8J57DRAFT_1421249 [Mycena rebaudengoi]
MAFSVVQSSVYSLYFLSCVLFCYSKALLYISSFLHISLQQYSHIADGSWSIVADSRLILRLLWPFALLRPLCSTPYCLGSRKIPVRRCTFGGQMNGRRDPLVLGLIASINRLWISRTRRSPLWPGCSSVIRFPDNWFGFIDYLRP